MKYNFEMEEKIRVGFIGCGGHSFRNIYPTFQYAPVDLVAVCDLDAERARAYARQFGALRWYTDHREMLEKEEGLDAVFIVTGYDPEGRPQYPRLAADAMRAGCHAWIEKPPASSVAEVEEMMGVSRETGRFVMVGFKKCFYPAIERTKEIVSREEFGRPASIYVRYPLALPPEEQRRDQGRMRGFLDHIVHPASILQYLMGKTERIYFEEEGLNGGSVTSMRFVSGAVGALHLAAGQSRTGPLERVEVVGKGANVVVDNGVEITYYRRGRRGAGGYGRSTDYMGDDASAPIHWEPEFSLGQLYNKGLFLLGYAQEVMHFAQCVLRGSPPEKCGLGDALEVMKLYEAYRNPSSRVIRVN